MSEDLPPKIILASGSPRRRELLGQLGWRFEVLPAGINESAAQGEVPNDYVRRLSVEKALAVADQNVTADVNIIIGSDTTVVIDGEMLGKPRSDADVQGMLGKLSGQTHQVYTGVSTVIYPNAVKNGAEPLREACRELGFDPKIEERKLGGAHALIASYVVSTQVTFKNLSLAEVERYCATGEPFGKAGSYAIQGYAAAFVSSLQGSYSAVVGLPMYETNEMIKACSAFLMSELRS